MSVRDRFEAFQIYPGSNVQTFSLPRQQRTYRLVSLTMQITHDSSGTERRYTLLHQIQLGNGAAITIAEWSAMAGGLDAVARLSYTTAEGLAWDATHAYMRVQIPQDLIVEPGQSLVFAIENGVGSSDQIEQVIAQVKWLDRAQDK
jgi:hypothetical protein